MTTTEAIPSKSLDSTQIAALIPHSGSMCLLDHVVGYDNQRIHCVAHSHRLLNNPLLEDGMLHAVCGIEYAAQAMAVHGAIMTKNQQPRGGRLASVRTAEFFVSRLDDIPNHLDIYAKQIMGDADSMVYEFLIYDANRVLLQGKATVVLLT